MRRISLHKLTDGQPRQVGAGDAEQSYEICYAGACGQDVIVDLDFGGLGSSGVTTEVLLTVVIDRLEEFQRGQHACVRNQIAENHCRAALDMLGFRIRKR